jgi:hypothetical protein
MLMARILDRAATLSYIGLDDAQTALAQAKSADLYFRVASGLSSQSPDYRNLGSANATTTNIQLATLQTDIAHKPNNADTRLALTISTPLLAR